MLGIEFFSFGTLVVRFSFPVDVLPLIAVISVRALEPVPYLACESEALVTNAVLGIRVNFWVVAGAD